MHSLCSPLGSRQRGYPTTTLLRTLQSGNVSTNLEITTFPLQTLLPMRIGTYCRICKFGQGSTPSAIPFLQKVRLGPQGWESDQEWGAGSRIHTDKWTMPAMLSRSGEGESVQNKGSANHGPSPMAIWKEQTPRGIIGRCGDRSPCPSTTKVQPGPGKTSSCSIVSILLTVGVSYLGRNRRWWNWFLSPSWGGVTSLLHTTTEAQWESQHLSEVEAELPSVRILLKCTPDPDAFNGWLESSHVEPRANSSHQRQDNGQPLHTARCWCL